MIVFPHTPNAVGWWLKRYKVTDGLETTVMPSVCKRSWNTCSIGCGSGHSVASPLARLLRLEMGEFMSLLLVIGLPRPFSRVCPSSLSIWRTPRTPTLSLLPMVGGTMTLLDVLGAIRQCYCMSINGHSFHLRLCNSQRKILKGQRRDFDMVVTLGA
uniref:Uncharacterized protein n=1 Tax=Oryza glumipatula TaxID=40148 RepID=A0A0D9YXA1_9ORYZ